MQSNKDKIVSKRSNPFVNSSIEAVAASSWTIGRASKLQSKCKAYNLDSKGLVAAIEKRELCLYALKLHTFKRFFMYASDIMAVETEVVVLFLNVPTGYAQFLRWKQVHSCTS